MSPPPPAMPYGWVWQPAHELESGAEMRLKLLAPSRGLVGSLSFAPVPLVSGRPPPSSMVQTAVNSCFPYATRSRRGIENSWPSWRWRGTAPPRPRPDCDWTVVIAAAQNTRNTPRTAADVRMTSFSFHGSSRKPSRGLQRFWIAFYPDIRAETRTRGSHRL